MFCLVKFIHYQEKKGIIETELQSSDIHRNIGLNGVKPALTETGN